MTNYLSTKQLSLALAVSEATIKRWCDKGLLKASRTAGGHRRLAVNEVLQFIRQNDYQLAQPELIGLPATTKKSENKIENVLQQTISAMVEGNETLLKELIFSMYLSGHRASEICDKVIANAFYQLGDSWRCGKLEIYQERRGCEMIIRVLHLLHEMLPEVAKNAPLAIGGTLKDDHYEIPSTMIAITLKEEGFNVQPLGCNLPAKAMQTAIIKNKPALFWLSVSHIVDKEGFLKQADLIFKTAEAMGTLVAIGGREIKENLRKELKYTAHCDSMLHLASFVSSIKKHLTNAKK